jgi:HAD superfamily hydrolase (TIGR01509 family)
VGQAFVVFDLDGTLIESEQIWRDVRHAFVVANGGHWKSDAATAMIGMRTDEWARYMHDALGVALAPSAIAKRVVECIAERLKNPPVLPGADAALRRLAREFRLGLASSAAVEVAQTVLAAAGWSDLFAVVVSADEVARGKPEPDVYLRALELLDADPSRTAAVEDSANGIRSAFAARLAVIAIPNRAFPPDAEALSLASLVVANLDDLDAALIREVLRLPETMG